MKKAFKNFILFLNIICIALCFFNITAFAETQYTVSVSILSDNITLAQYTVLTPQIANLEALGGDRAAFTADDTGAVNSITVNGRTLKADGEHFITVHLNGREIQSCEVKVADGDAFVFKYITNESEPVSSKTESGREPVSSKRPHVSSAQTSSSQSEPAAQQSNTDISSDKAEDISSTKSEASSESVSSRESAETSSFVNPNRYKWDSELDDILDSACSWLSVNDDSMMQLIALSSAGKPARANAVDKFLQSVKVNGGAFTSDADIFYAVLSSTFSGIDAENVRDINLIEIMLKKKYEYLKNAYYSAMMLISLDSNNYLSEDGGIRRELVNSIAALVNNDGGFSNGPGKSDIGTTAIVLTALSGYKSVVPDTIANAVAYISDTLKQSSKRLNGIQTAKTIIAINSLGLSMDDGRFLNDGENLVMTAKKYIGADGGFKNLIGGNSDNTATEYFVLALVSLKNGISPYVINYQSRGETSSDVPASKSGLNFYLSIIIVLIFLTIVGLMIFGFFYAKKKYAKGTAADTIRYIFENKGDKK